MYTKGGWVVEDKTNVVAGDRLVANTGGYSNNVHSARAENEANAHLIASAPDLYEALKLARDALTIKLDKPTYQEILEFKNRTEPIILRALAKAEGK